MKRIYTFTLDNDEYPSDSFKYNLRIIADILYSEIGAYDKALNVNKNIRQNKLYEGDMFHKCYFDSEVYDKNNYNYEPFIVGDKSFAFTVDDEYIDEEALRIWLAYTLRLVKSQCAVTINSFPYSSANKDDESNRHKAIKEIFKTIDNKTTIGIGFARKLVNLKNSPKRNRLSMYRG